MALTTYTELKTSIGDWLNRSDLTTAIPDFISLAEAQITVYQNGQKLLGSQWSKAGAIITIDPNSHYDGSNY